MPDIAYISAFLSHPNVEGIRQTTGYIPCNLKTGGTANYKGGPNPDRYQAMGASGVTIATGCDLGQTDAATLASYGLEDAICGIYAPYFGKKKDAAIQTLRKWPLVVTPDAARKTDEAVHGGYLRRYTIPAYEKDSGLSFASLPKGAQAAIASICFQKGVGGTRRGAPKTWKSLCEGNWKAACEELLYHFASYQLRRAWEGRQLALMLASEKHADGCGLLLAANKRVAEIEAELARKRSKA